MRSWHALGALLRIELRNARRRPRSSWLVAVAIAVPVAAVAGGGTILRITRVTDEEARTARLGSADLRIENFSAAADSTLHSLLPPPATWSRVTEGAEGVRVPGRRLMVRGLALDEPARTADPMAGGMIRIVRGRAPRDAGEVALSETVLELLGREIGDRVTLDYGTTRVVTGVAQNPESLDDVFLLRTRASAEDRGRTFALVSLTPPDDARDVATRLREAGLEVTARPEIDAADRDLDAVVFLLGGIGLLEAALVIAASLTVGLRRRQREIGLTTSVGCDPRDLALALHVALGATAAVGAVLGALVGVLAAAAVHPALPGLNARDDGPFEVSWLHVYGGIALGLGTALVAGALPARRAIRLPVREALGARRPVTAPAHGWLAVGLAFVAASVALLLLSGDGSRAAAWRLPLASALGVLGFGACSPWVLQVLARGADRLPLALRLAVRDAGRFRARNGPVITAVLAGMAISVTVACLLTSVENAIGRMPARLARDQLLVEGPEAAAVADRIADALPTLAVAPLAGAYANGLPVLATSDSVAGPEDWVAVGNELLLRALGAESALDAFRAGSLIALGERETKSWRLTAWRSGGEIARPQTRPVERDGNVRSPRFVIARSALEPSGLTAGPPPRKTLMPTLVRLAADVDPPALERAREIAAAAPHTTIEAEITNRRPSTRYYGAVFVACLVTGLLVILVATALTAEEAAIDDRLLGLVGAPVRLVRHRSATRAAFLAGIGCILAVPAGMIPAYGLLSVANVPLEFVVPWSRLAVTAFGLPALTYVLTWIASRPTLTARIAATISLLVFLSTPAASATEPVRWTPWEGRSADGTPIRGEIGRLTVPADRSDPDPGSVELAFLRLRTTNPRPGPPIFFLAGGPGAEGIANGVLWATHPRVRLLEHSDVIALDQRGTGCSVPNLAEPEVPYELPRDRPVRRDDELREFRAAIERARDQWEARGVDLADFDTVASADDVDDVRAALGIQRVVLFGASYGTHLGIAYLRRHGDRVERAVLSRVEGPDDTWKLPSVQQRVLARLTEMAARDPDIRSTLPNVEASVRGLLERLAREPVCCERAGDDGGGLVLGPRDLQYALAVSLGETRRIAEIPRLLVSLERGRWEELATRAIDRHGVVGNAMAIAMDCASGASPSRRARIRREANDPANLLGDAICGPFYPEACVADCEPLGPGFREAFSCDVPTLFVSGELDARTPPENVERLRSGFANSTHVTVAFAAHDARELMSDEFRDLLQAFLRGEPVEDCVVELPFRFDRIEPDEAIARNPGPE
ncbi:MAG: alpha/beta fold hydrolase [Gemmatimonadetes bacterium]|nr:alpha/beta fold hydrolase [Gemmatimonadota bacterium]